MKKVLIEELKEIWFFAKLGLMVSGVFFWILVILWKLGGLL